MQQVSSAIPSSSPARVSGQPLVLQDTAPPARAPARLKGTTVETAAHEDLKIPLLGTFFLTTFTHLDMLLLFNQLNFGTTYDHLLR